MKLEVLISCMDQKDFRILEQMNISSDVLIVNQCSENGYIEMKDKEYIYRMIKTTKRGLSRSRNECINNMTGDIGLICDDDVIYYKNYKEIIVSAFLKLKDADIIVFDIDAINSDRNGYRKKKKIRRAPKYKNYSSVTIAFRQKSLLENNIWFDLNFGSGAIYSSGEESLLLREANRKKLKIYEYPATIAKVDFSKSSWFREYDKKYFYDKGAWIKAAYPRTYFLYKWYFLKLYKYSNLSFMEIIMTINEGIKSYKLKRKYDDYLKQNELKKERKKHDRF